MDLLDMPAGIAVIGGAGCALVLVAFRKILQRNATPAQLLWDVLWWGYLFVVIPLVLRSVMDRFQ